MALHKPVPSSESHYPAAETDTVLTADPCENSSRILCIHKRMLQLEDRLQRQKCVRVKQLWPRPRFVPLDPDPCDRATIELAHSSEHYDNMMRTAFLSDQELRDIAVDDDLYFCRDTFLAASLAAGGVVNCVDAVLESSVTGVGPTRAIALVRPPGHHATHNRAMGFCYFNNIAIAAKHAIHTKQAERVLILDWDIHHGNGIQDICYEDPNIFYLSIHRAAFGHTVPQEDWFYPGTGRHDETGRGAGAGTNLNIVWPKGGMGNVEYAAAFSEVVLPVVSAFSPDLILIACGLDAAKGDTLGDCGLSPDMFYTMTNSLLEQVGDDIPFVVALEGGYDLDTISVCMEAVALAMLDEPWDGDVLVPPARACGAGDGAPMEPMEEQEMSLSLYWNRDEYNDENSKKQKTTKRALAAIKKSARALANKGTVLGSMRFTNHSAKASSTFNPNKPPVPDYRFCAANDCTVAAFVPPRNHRPYQDGDVDHLPFKKRKLMIEMEAASKLLAFTHNCC